MAITVSIMAQAVMNDGPHNGVWRPNRTNHMDSMRPGVVRMGAGQDGSMTGQVGQTRSRVGEGGTQR